MITFQVPEVSPARIGPMVAVFRYAPQVGYQPLSCVKCVEVSFREGAEPSKALFQYVTGNYLIDMVTIGFEKVLPLRRVGDPDVIETDDELVVATLLPSGGFKFLFHGYAQVPQVTLSDRQQDVHFMAQGVEARCWHEPIGYAEMRDAGNPTDPAKNVQTGLDVRFNPRIKDVATGNMVASGHDWEAVNSQGFKYCNFIDPNIDKTVSVDGKFVPVRGRWTLYQAINYLFCTENEGWEFVRTWEPENLKPLLATYTPKDGDFIDYDDPSTYIMSDPIIADTDVRGEPWPVAAEKLLKPAGFGVCFRIGDDGTWPVTWFDAYKLNQASDSMHKDLYLQDWFDRLDPARTNVGNAKLASDISGVINVVSVDTAPVRVEAGFVLAGLFDTAPGDVAAVDTFKKSHASFRQVAEKYRSFGFDECGEGHLEPTFSAPDANGVRTFTDLTHVFSVADLTPLFGEDDDGIPLFVPRRRPPYAETWTKDSKKQYIKHELYISYDYNGPVPAVWDGVTGTWVRVVGGYRLHDDRLGILVTAPDANAWNTGKPIKGQPAAKGQASGVVKAVEWMGSTDATKRRAFTLMLVCKVESDQHLNVTADRRPVSPTSFRVNTIIDLRSRLTPGLIHKSSINHPDHADAGAASIVVGNEYDEAMIYAETRREALQLGRFAGDATIPRLSLAYRIGDRIRKIAGREASLQTNRDANGHESPAYPRVIGITYKMDKGFDTSIVLSDARSDTYAL